MDRSCDECHHKHKCCKRCVGTFDVKHKIYEICCYEVVRMCHHCGMEFDFKKHHRCPRCGMGVHDFMHHKFGQYGGTKHGYDGFGYGREMDPEEDY